MAQHALGKQGIVHALQAKKGERYWCLECQVPVTLRKGKYMPHFYHASPSPQCRLYSKSEDHLLLQLQLQNFFPKGELEIEKTFLQINRVADLYWEREKIVFEIQCSSFELGEAQSRVHNYGQVSCDVIWLLDDRIFNRRQVHPAEEWVRSRGAYYIKFQRDQPLSLFYDQFEINLHSERLKKSFPLKIDLRFPQKLFPTKWPSPLPSCIVKRIPTMVCSFRGDLLSRTFHSSATRWAFFEKQLLRHHSRFYKWVRRFIADPCEKVLLFLIEKLEP